MIAKITRLLLLIQAALIIAIGALSHAFDLSWSSSLAWGVIAVLVLRLLITATNFSLSAVFRARLPAAARLSMLGWLRLYLQEFGATLITSSWTMPWRAFRHRDGFNSSSLPVLLLHGYACNSGYWTSMSAVLSAHGIAHHALDLEPIGGDIDGYADQIDAAIKSLCTNSGAEEIIVLAHSMGGLATRAAIRRHGCTHIAGVITLGTPHHGTGLAQFGAGKNSQQMRWYGRAGIGQPNPWLSELGTSESRQIRALFSSVLTLHDNIVSPSESCRLEGAMNHAFTGIGHVALARHPAIQQFVLGEIARISTSIGE